MAWMCATFFLFGVLLAREAPAATRWFVAALRGGPPSPPSLPPSGGTG